MFDKIKKLLINLNLFIQIHFVACVILCIVLMIIVNWIWFSIMDPNDNSDNFAFNRSTIILEKDQNGNTIKSKFLSDSFTDACHYTLTTMSTVGYGDITPKSSGAKYWTMIMHIIAIVMSLKIFEYFITDDASSKALLKQINILDSENEDLTKRNNELQKLLNNKCISTAITKLKKNTSISNLNNNKATIYAVSEKTK